MARRGGSLYVSTDPNNVVPIGVPGQGISIGPLGTKIYNPANVDTPTDGGTQNITIEGMLTEATINPSANLSALTLTFGNGPVATAQLFIVFNKNVTTLSFSGANIATTPTLPATAAAGLRISFAWNGTQWLRTS